MSAGKAANAVADPPSSATGMEMDISGMTCGACATRVERALNSLPGVRARVNLATARAWVEIDDTVTLSDVVDAIDRLGYRAERRDRLVPPGDPDRHRVRELAPRLMVAVALWAPLGDLSISMVLAPSLRFPGWQWVLAALTVPLATWCAWPLHRAAARNARHGVATMDTLVSAGVLAATAWSFYTMFFQPAPSGRGGLWALASRPSGSIYLDVVAGIVTFALTGRLVEAKARRRAGRALRALAATQPSHVSLLEADGTERTLRTDALVPGDRFVVRPGEVIATDGRVVDGRAALDAAAITGESRPLVVDSGDDVLAGMVDLDGRLVVEATSVGADSSLVRLVSLVETAQNAKAGAQRAADRVASVLVPVVIALSVLTLAGWVLLSGSPQKAFNAGLAVLVVACPCALGLATPVALMVAAGRGAQLGVFIKSQRALECARAINVVVLDKTGTLTEAQLTVRSMVAAVGVDRSEALRLAGALEAASGHVVARAVADLAGDEGGPLPAAADVVAVPGLGVTGRVDGHQVLVGSPRLLAERSLGLPAELDGWRTDAEAAGDTMVLAAVDGAVALGIALADTLRPSAVSAVEELHALGVRTVLLSGDTSAATRRVAAAVGIDEVIAPVRPEQKADVIAELRAGGTSVAMVGDGINDGPALAGADVGVAVAGGTELAFEAADLVLGRDDLRLVPRAVRLARATVRTVHTNLAWAFGYNLAAVPLAAAGLLNPLIASAAMASSSVLVIANSLRLHAAAGPPSTTAASTAAMSPRPAANQVVA
jgi:heavy metal translocating P-type ATPase